MSSIFDENNMMQALKKNLPDGETLTAGIHGLGLETEIKQVFGKCTLVGEKLVPNENGIAIEVSKCKYSTHDVYIGISQNYFILSECEVYQHYYEFNDVPNRDGISVEDLKDEIGIEELRSSFLFSEIQKCVIKKGWMGSVKCTLTMKGGSLLKLMLPKRGGLGGGMSHHAEYREAIIARLRALEELGQ